MPLTRSEKEAAVALLVERFQSSEAVLLTDYRGLTVAQLGQLRRELRAKNAELHIVKNSLALRALDEVGMELPAELVNGPTAMAFLREDLAGPTKVLKDFAKETKDLMAIRGGFMGVAVMDAKGALALADLPSREELLSQLVGLLQQPQRQLLSVLSAPMRDFLNVLNAKAAEAETTAEAA